MNYFLILIISIFLISQDFLLFNEETLILFCFINFFMLVSTKLSEPISENFNLQKTKIENDFLICLNEFISIYKTWKNWNSEIKKFSLNLTNLKSHYLNFNVFIASQLLQYQKNKKQKIFTEKVTQIFQVEQQTAKLIVLLFNQRLKNLVFFTNLLDKVSGIKKIKCFTQIKLREQIKNL